MKAVCLDIRILYHPLLRRLPPSQRWVFLTLLLLCGREGRLAYGDTALGERDLADQAGVSPEEAGRALERFLELGLVELEGGVLSLSPEWHFQLPSHSPDRQEGKARRASTERVRRYRQKARSVKGNCKEEFETPNEIFETGDETLDETRYRKRHETGDETRYRKRHETPNETLGNPDGKPNETPCNALNETLGTRYRKRLETGNETQDETRYRKRDETLSETRGGLDLRDRERGSGVQFKPKSEHEPVLEEEENELKEKEERSKEEREGVFLSPWRNTHFSPEREKEKESREGGKEETPLLPQALPSSALPHSGEREPPPERAPLEGEGSLNLDGEGTALGESEYEKVATPGESGAGNGQGALPGESEAGRLAGGRESGRERVTERASPGLEAQMEEREKEEMTLSADGFLAQKEEFVQADAGPGDHRALYPDMSPGICPDGKSRRSFSGPPPPQEQEDEKDGLGLPQGEFKGVRDGLVPLKEILDKNFRLASPQGELEAQRKDPAPHLKRNGDKWSRASPEELERIEAQKENLLEFILASS